jgi:ribosome biogenesis GTPase A
MSAGPYNVVEAIREARNVQDVRSPEGLWNAILGQMVKKFGYRAMPQQADMAPKEQSRQSKEMAQIKAITGEQ